MNIKRVFLVLAAALLLPGLALAGVTTGNANFLVNLTFNPDTGNPTTTARIDCNAVDAPNMENQENVGDGGSVIELDHHGCHYTGVSPGHANFCQVQVAKEATRLTVYKRWIGGTGEEPNIHIHLVCNQQTQDIVLWINADSSQTWELEVSDPDGIRCSVYEDELESFRADQSDCSDLLILPGADEACTLVNTKVVKRIETLNRYGLGAMILIMLTAGLLAIKRLVQ